LKWTQLGKFLPQHDTIQDRADISPMLTNVSESVTTNISSAVTDSISNSTTTATDCQVTETDSGNTNTVAAATEFIQCRISEVLSLTHDTNLYTLNLPEGYHMEVPTGHHLRLKASILGQFTV